MPVADENAYFGDIFNNSNLSKYLIRVINQNYI